MNAIAYRRRLALTVPTITVVAVVLAGTVNVAEIALAFAAAVLATAYDASVTRTARAWFRPPLRWSVAILRAISQMIAESALLSLALGRQLIGRAELAGAEDVGRIVLTDADAMTTAIAATLYPCLTPNTVVRQARRGRVTGRRLLDIRGHALADDLARLA